METSTTPAVRPNRTLRDAVAGRPLTSFAVIFLLTAWPTLWTLPLAAHGVSAWSTIAKYAPGIVTIAMLGAALFVTWAQEGSEGIRRYIARIFRWRFSLLWWALALLALPTAAVACSLAFGNAIKNVSLATLIVASLWGTLKAMFTINLWEESVWMGFFQTRLERRHSLLVAALITAIPFSAAHLPLQFMGEISWGNVLGGFLVLCAAAIVFRLIGAVILRGARDSLLAVGVMHAMFNQVSQPGGILTTLFPGADPGMSAVIALAVALPVLLWFARGKLSRAYRLSVLESGAGMSSSVELSASFNNSSR